MAECFAFNPLGDFPFCQVCGGALVEFHAKTICPRCNYKRGCCDLL